MKFVKMHGIGNDYVFVDEFEGELARPEEAAISISRPHFSIGSDGLILIGRSDVADARMRIFNADGSEAEMCGNGLRCVAKYLADSGRVSGRWMTIETGAGIRRAAVDSVGGAVSMVTADMGEPALEAERIPVKAFGNRAYIKLSGGEIREFTCVSMGNPHAVTFIAGASSDMCLRDGPLVERAECFPMRTNAEFAEMESECKMRVNVWERGSGATLACGTGACASVVAGVINGVCPRRCEVALPGGSLTVEWRETDGRVYLTGPAEIAFRGEIDVPS